MVLPLPRATVLRVAVVFKAKTIVTIAATVGLLPLDVLRRPAVEMAMSAVLTADGRT
jgi:hypothetical protein